MSTLNPAQAVKNLGQSIWYDNISRELLQSGEIRRLVAEWGVRGLTSNPAIFHKAITSGKAYAADIANLKSSGMSPDQIIEELSVADISQAADELLSVYINSKGEDGYVSIEVSPLLASNAEATVEEAVRLFKKLSRPNIMIKVPGTEECLSAIEELIFLGINVNVTLLFSVANYEQVANAYMRGLTRRHQAGQPLDCISSVASFFISRVDSLIDARLSALLDKQPQAKEFCGKAAIANAALAYNSFKRIFSSNEFLKLQNAGARVQRPLWASTSTKNPEYRDVIYIDELIAPDTVNTVPHATLAAYVDHGAPSTRFFDYLETAAGSIEQISRLGIDFEAALKSLQVDGVSQFVKAFTDLREAIVRA